MPRTTLHVGELQGERGFRLVGELDMSTAPRLADAIEAPLQAGGDLVLEVSELTFMDSTGLQVLIRAALQLGQRGTITLRSPAPLVRSILGMTMRGNVLSNLVIEDGP